MLIGIPLAYRHAPDLAHRGFSLLKQLTSVVDTKHLYELIWELNMRTLTLVEDWGSFVEELPEMVEWDTFELQNLWQLMKAQLWNDPNAEEWMCLLVEKLQGIDSWSMETQIGVWSLFQGFRISLQSQERILAAIPPPEDDAPFSLHSLVAKQFQQS